MTMRNKSFPNEWADDQVMDVLFSPFRGSRDVNPRSWDSKMKFWTDLIHNYCADKKVLTLNVRTLALVFERKGKVPSCLNVVIDDLKRRGIIQSMTDYSTSTNSSWLSWSLNVFVKKPVQWSYNNVIKSSFSWAYGLVAGKSNNDVYQPKSRIERLNELPDEQFVLLDLVKTAADAIYQRHKESVVYEVTDKVIAYSALKNSCRDICADDQSFHVAILELVRQKLCTLATSNDGEQLIRMVIDKRDAATPLSENEERIYQLKATIRKLEENASKISEEMEECRKAAKALLQQNRKSAALKCLRRKKILAENLSQKENAIDKIHDLINSIQQAESQKQIIDAYQSGVAAFKRITKEKGLNENNIDDTMLDVQEAFEVNEQINAALGQPIGGSVDLSDSDLEDELEDILSDKKLIVSPPRGQEDNVGPDFDLPDVPEKEPNFSPAKNEQSRTPVLSP